MSNKVSNVPFHWIEQALLEYSDRVIFPMVQDTLEAHGRRHRFPSNAQLSGLFQIARGIQRSEDLFKQDQNDECFQNFLEGRIHLAKRRRDEHLEQFFTTIYQILFGNDKVALRRAASAILEEVYVREFDLPKHKISPEERESSRLFLFQEWIKHFFFGTKYRMQNHSSHHHKSRSQNPRKPSQRTPGNPNSNRPNSKNRRPDKHSGLHRK